MHGLTGGSWKRNRDRARATEMKDTRGNPAVTSGSETYRRSSLPRQISTLLVVVLVRDAQPAMAIDERANMGRARIPRTDAPGWNRLIRRSSRPRTGLVPTPFPN